MNLTGYSMFLASDDSSCVTGIDLCVDGGAAQVQATARGSAAAMFQHLPRTLPAAW
jgi:hypothetical protein